MANTGDPESVAAAQPTDPADPTPDTVSPAWCIVANIVGEHAYGPGGVQTRVGTRKLRAGSKVFVVGSFSGMGSETVTVVGRLRYTNRYITISIAAKYLRNHRVRLVYSPFVIQQARTNRPASWDVSSPEAHALMEQLADVIVEYAGSTRVELRDGPFAGDRRTFPAGQVPETLIQHDADGTEIRYRLHHNPKRQWYTVI